MTFATVLRLKLAGIASLCLAALSAIGCANPSGLPTSPSATSAPSQLTATAPDDNGPAAAPFPRSGIFHVAKECSEFDGTNGTFCTITSSTLAQIEAGSRVIYATVNGFGDLDSDVVLDLPGPGNNAAFGHCTLNATVSECIFSGGTGKFTHFSAKVAVSSPGGVDFDWHGTYSFSPRD